MGTLLRVVAAIFSITTSSAAFAQQPAAQTEYTPEEYTERGQTNGCGVSFLTVWQGDGGEILGVSGSINFLLVPEHKNVMAIIKATALLNNKQTKITYAWLESPGYGRSRDFVKGQAQDPSGFVGVKNADPKAMILVSDLANFGGTLGVLREGRPLDDTVKLPSPPPAIAKKTVACFDNLNVRMRAIFH